MEDFDFMIIDDFDSLENQHFEHNEPCLFLEPMQSHSESIFPSENESKNMDWAHYSSISSSHSSSSLSGRKKATFTLILEKFFTTQTLHPKKEFFNAFVIRSLKRAFRYLEQDKIPLKTCIAPDLSVALEVKIWNKFKNLYSKHSDLFSKLASTKTSPLTDGKSKRKSDKQRSSPKSFNNAYCREFFAQEPIREAFLLLLDLLFANPNPSKLREKLNFSCCTLDEHINKCHWDWNDLKEYLQNNYFSDLEVQQPNKRRSN